MLRRVAFALAERHHLALEGEALLAERDIDLSGEQAQRPGIQLHLNALLPRPPGTYQERSATQSTRQGHRALKPPSSSRSDPVMKLLSSDARNTAPRAISPGRPHRPSGD